MGEVVRLKYTGSALPGNAELVNIASSVSLFSGAGMAQGAGLKRLVVSIKHDASGTLKFYSSRDRANGAATVSSWTQVADSGAIAAPTYTSTYDYVIEPHMDWKLDWLNGATPQTTFSVDVALTDERGPTV